MLLEDFTHVKFYRLSLRASVELDGHQFEDGFHHVEDWVPQRLVTATGPNPGVTDRTSSEFTTTSGLQRRLGLWR